MEDDYTTYSFAELLSNIVDNRGKTCPVDDAGLPLIATNCVKNDTLFPVFKKVRYVNQETYDTWFRGHPEPGDMIFVCKGSPGNVCWTPEPVNFCIAQDMVAIRANQKIVDSKYLFSLLRSPVTQTKILNMHVGTLIPHFKKGDFKNLYFDIPNDKGVQKAIGNIYFRFSERIELNSRMNETLEAMAQALFKSWFVDFDPLIDNALDNGKEIPAELSQKAQARAALGDKRKPLPEKIRTLFPDEFTYSDELDWIPKGWEVEQIREMADAIQYGFTTSASEDPVGPKFLRITDIRGGQVNWDTVPYCEVSDQDLKKYRIHEGDIFVARTGASTGENIYIVEPQEAVFASYLVRFSFSNAAIARFVGIYMRTSAYFSYVQGTLGGSAQPNASAQVLASANMLFPPDQIAQEFFDTISLYDRMSAAKERQSINLTNLRDTLLPKLLSGELRIPDAEKMVEELTL